MDKEKTAWRTRYKKILSSFVFISFLFFNLLFLSKSCFAQPATPVPVPYPSPQLSLDQTQAELIRRGEYLTKAGDCIACHTDTKHAGKPFAGGLAFFTPFGSLYSPNITPDKETGIGNWTDKDFIRAMQHGIAPDGSYYYPVFPFVSFSKISQPDLLAIKAYLFSIPAIKKTNQANEMLWPFNWRFLQLGWRILFFHSANEYQNNLSQSEEWNRGAYLVQGLGHCGMCHTPLNLLGAEKKKYYLTGGFIEGYYADNITESGLKNASLDDLRAVFKQGKPLHGKGKVAGPMADVILNSLSYLNDEDLNAISTYLKTVKTKPPSSPFSGTITAATGKKVYQSYCAVCHGTGAAGAPKLGDQAEWQRRLAKGKDHVYELAIEGFNSMPPKGTCAGCSDAAVKAAVDFMLNTQSETTQAVPVQEAPVSPQTGRLVYQQACAGCHSNRRVFPSTPQLGDKKVWQPRIAKGMDVLFIHTIEGYNTMPPKGGCNDCSNAEIEASVKYLVEKSKAQGNYSLW